MSSGRQSSATVPLRCHSDQSTATQTKMWVNFTNGQPLHQLFAILPKECHLVIFSATQLPLFWHLVNALSSGSQVVVKWQSSGHQVVNKWQSSGSQVTVKWESSGSQVAVKWSSSGHQVAVKKSSSGHQVAVKWWSSGIQWLSSSS